MIYRVHTFLIIFHKNNKQTNKKNICFFAKIYKKKKQTDSGTFCKTFISGSFFANI